MELARCTSRCIGICPLVTLLLVGLVYAWNYDDLGNISPTVEQPKNFSPWKVSPDLMLDSTGKLPQRVISLNVLYIDHSHSENSIVGSILDSHQYSHVIVKRIKMYTHTIIFTEHHILLVATAYYKSYLLEAYPNMVAHRPFSYN